MYNLFCYHVNWFQLFFVQHFPFHEFNACCQEDLLPIVENYEFQYDGVEGVQLKAFHQKTDKQNNWRFVTNDQHDKTQIQVR